ncbi:MAG: hypothetical protein M1833_001685 [Piccolia ochrophora]|nr:MAG: hypothetical protein M1833_001685 [Piccolia ochrophora]
MPLQALLRRNRKSDLDLRRRHSSVIDASHIASHLDGEQGSSERVSTSVDHETPQELAAPPVRPNTANVSTAESSGDARTHETSTNNRTGSGTLRPQRFSLMKFRHASDSQLSTRAKQQAAQASAPPPMPSVSAAPAIITTAPTMDSLERSQKKRGKMKMPGRLRLSSERTSRADVSPHKESHSESNSTSGSQTIRNGGARAGRVTFDEPTRPQPHGLSEPPPYGDESSSSLALPISRLSESSRSDGSSGEPIAYATTTTHTVSTTTTFFRLPRRKKPQQSLFPRPVRITPNDSALSSQTSPHGSARGIPHSVNQSPRGFPLGGGSGPGSPLKSPSRLTLDGLSGTAPGSQSVPVFRKNSTTSAHSARSSPSLAPPMRLGRNGRSSTKGSMDHVPDEMPLPTPPLPSGRTSTSTTGRSSLGGIFGLSRLRQSSEPPYGRNASPGTPCSATSKTNSFSLPRDTIVVPEREPDETPAKYLARLQEAVSRGVVAGLVSRSDDAFSKAVLRSYMRSFAFFEDPMDMAIRKLLMEVELPKETQQIDRVVQQFADRYHECNPGIYISSDSAYFIAFSLMLLQSDVFNKNNKRKMQKHDYIKNARTEAVSEDVLECFFDNICYTPFIRVEDDLDINGERIVTHKARKPRFNRPSVDPIKGAIKGPVDPYTLILEQRLDVLRPNLKDVMYLDDPYSSLGTAASLDMKHLHRTFFRSGVLQIVSARSRPDAFKSPLTITNPQEAQAGLVDIKITKVGVLWRKDAKKKKGRSPWQEWGAILTGAQLYFFRNTTWAKNLLHQYDAHHKHGHASTPVLFKPPLDTFKPDALVSTDGAVALLDSSYKKHKNAFIFVRHGGFEETFLADSEADMNDWLSKLNYAATFRTAGVRMRAHIVGGAEGQPGKGVKRMDTNSSIHTAATAQSPSTETGEKGDPQLPQQILLARRQIMFQKIKEADERLRDAQSQLDAQLRNARHLQILAPVQASTRAQIVLAAGRAAAQVKWIRMEVWRLRCHREIMMLDLMDEQKTTSDPYFRSQNLQAILDSHTTTADGQKPNLNRLDSKASALAQQPTPSLSPRPPSRSSFKDKYGIDDSFLSDLSRHPSSRKGHASWELPPLSFENRPNARASGSTLAPGSPDRGSLVHQFSGSSGRQDLSVPLSQEDVQLATRNSSLDGDEIEVLRDAGIADADPTTPETKRSKLAIDGDVHQELSAEAESTDKSKVRRSLHRTLREAHVPVHHRSKKGKETAGSLTDDAASTNEVEGLARGTGSFTVHGKKASVINFGSDWHSMTAEDRFKLRKQAVVEDPKAPSTASTGDDVVDSERPPSVAYNENSFPSDLAQLGGGILREADSEAENAEASSSSLQVGNPEGRHSSASSLGSQTPRIPVANESTEEVRGIENVRTGQSSPQEASDSVKGQKTTPHLSPEDDYGSAAEDLEPQKSWTQPVTA